MLKVYAGGCDGYPPGWMRQVPDGLAACLYDACAQRVIPRAQVITYLTHDMSYVHSGVLTNFHHALRDRSIQCTIKQALSEGK